MEIVLNSFDDLIHLIKSDRLTPEQLKEVLGEGYHIFIFGNESKDEIIDFLEKYKNSKEVPVFVKNPLAK